ncbi:MAG: 16S rRNA (guanine(966)-N(2))-methyltransferase RsmD [Pantoea sp. Brub]|nr:16S rRNA (guanine(966)-N(2))-methyltransferase RsmD [Pantoea sp. Brub]
MTKVISNNYKLGKIRIVGGKWRGYKLPILNNIKLLRPTTDSMRETLFNWLSPIIKKANCLDCFSGSGALGLESLSRYANSATMLDLEYSLVNQIKQNLQKFKAMNAKVIQTDTLIWLKKQGQPFDIVFIDPPFQKNLIDKTVKLLESNGWLNTRSFIYIENSLGNNSPSIPQNWQLYRKKITGKVIYYLYIR